jgi:alpha-L-rhamnosidase
MFGSVSEWFYKWVAGIQADPTAVGFDKIVIRPQIIKDLEWVNAYHESIHGKIISAWERVENTFNLDVTIPVNCTAAVYLPAADKAKISESGTDIASVKDVQLVKMENGCAIIIVGSGNYSFESKLRRENDEKKP